MLQIIQIVALAGILVSDLPKINRRIALVKNSIDPSTYRTRVAHLWVLFLTTAPFMYHSLLLKNLLFKA